MPLQLNIKSRPTCTMLVGLFFCAFVTGLWFAGKKKTAAGRDGGESEFASS